MTVLGKREVMRNFLIEAKPGKPAPSQMHTNQLITTLDKFLERLTDFEEEFKFLKEDLKRVKAVIREKLGVSLD
jgi:hypothetical protein